MRSPPVGADEQIKNKKRLTFTSKSFFIYSAIVGVRRFELPTSATRTQRAARLRYTPNWIANVLIFLEKKNDPAVFFFADPHPFPQKTATVNLSKT